jgi:YbgC/YbaW family acyl-CoA thioester hydrolase
MEPDRRIIVRDRVRWSDVDRAQIVYFGKYLRWIEAAEAEFFRARGFTYDAIADRLGIFMARVHLSVDYRKMARLDDELACWAELHKVGGSSLHFTFPIERSGERVVDVKLVLACLDRATMKPHRVPADLRSALGSG